MFCDYDEGVVGYVEEGEGDDGLATRVSEDNIADIVEDHILYIVQLQVLWPFVQDDNSIIVCIVEDNILQVLLPLLHTLPSLPISSPPKTIPHSLAVGKLNYHRNYHHNHHGHGLHNNHCHLHFPKEFPLNGNDELLNFLKIFSSPTTGSHWDAERGRGCPTWGGRFCGGGVFWIFIGKFCRGDLFRIFYWNI